MTGLEWKTSATGTGLRLYSTRLADGRRVFVRATGQRNGRILGGAWAATCDLRTIATGGTLAACKEAVERLNA